MIEISENAYQILLNTLSDNLHVSSDYGSPPIFYWYRRIIEETNKIEGQRFLRRGKYKYQLGYSLGIAHVQCEYIGRNRVLIITNYEINNKVLFTWKRRNGKGGIIPNPKKSKPQKEYITLTKKPLFGYRFVMHKTTKKYNLINNEGKLLTYWFNDIRTLNQPMGQYQVIAYINCGGMGYALCLNGRIYPLQRMWKDMYCESKENRPTIENKEQIIRLTETQFMNLLTECISKIIKEIA